MMNCAAGVCGCTVQGPSQLTVSYYLIVEKGVADSMHAQRTVPRLTSAVNDSIIFTFYFYSIIVLFPSSRKAVYVESY